MKKLPKHIIKSVINNNTSLGDHPSFPPEDENNFLVWVLSKFYETIPIDTDNDKEIQSELSSLIKSCKKAEMTNKDAIEELCNKFITELFEIPEDTIIIKANIVDNVDTSNQRLLPEKTDDFTFDSIDDMTNLTDEIYKRRMLNCLIIGASMFYANNISLYVEDLFKINPELPSLYSKILSLNNKLIFLKKDTIDTNNTTDAGKVDVYISSSDDKVTINSEAILLPILIEETIRGILELAISHGLPKDKEKAEYIIKKADFKLAELWDIRIGCALWDIIIKLIGKTDIDIDEVGINFLFMKLSMLEPYEFNKNLQEIFRGTRQGIKIISDMCYDIISEKEKDDFDEFITNKSKDYTITDGYYSSDELDSDNYFNSNELLSDSIE